MDPKDFGHAQADLEQLKYFERMAASVARSPVVEILTVEGRFTFPGLSDILKQPILDKIAHHTERLKQY